MQYPNHYQTLEVSPTATQAEIKQAYRQMVKRFHPDRNPEVANHDRISSINIAYEVLGDPHRRHTYDLQFTTYSRLSSAGARYSDGTRQQRTANAQAQHRQRQSGYNADEQLKLWLNRVYQPVNRLLYEILHPLQGQLDDLSADPFDDELLEDFQSYLDDCRELLQKAQGCFKSIPNPSTVAGVAADLYYCLDQVGDGIDELERFTSSYNEHYLHTGQELFRIAAGLRRQAQTGIRNLG